MPGSHVRTPFPLIRQQPWYPGQAGGVPGTDTDTGLRTHPTGKVLYVDPNYPGASDNRDGTDPTDPLLTVAAALALCRDYHGDVIQIGSNDAWKYGGGAADYGTVISEAVTVTVQGVTIRGLAPSGSMGVVWQPPTPGAVCITVLAMDCLIEGITFQGSLGGDGIYAEWDGITLWGENLTVRHCSFDSDIGIAIQLEYAWNCEIYDCLFVGCDEYGVYVDPAGSGADYLRIHDNIFHECTKAMGLRGVEESWIWGNQLYKASAVAAAASVDVFIDTTSGAHNLVSHNVLSCLLPVPANGDYDDTCTAAATDAWVSNYCMDGPTVTNPT